MKSAVFASAAPSPIAAAAASTSPGPNNTGSTTRITTVSRSSTISHPVAILPPSVPARPASARFLMSTTVEAMDTESPKHHARLKRPTERKPHAATG